MKILVAVDVSQSSQVGKSGAEGKEFDTAQLSQLESVVGLKGAEVILLFVQEELPSYEAILKTQADFPEDLGHKVESAARTKLDSLAEKFKAAGAQVKVEIVHGPAAYMIEQVARDHAVNLTVVTAGVRAGEVFLIGGTSHHIIRHAPSSVVILRQDKNAAASGKGSVQKVLVGVDGSDRCLESVVSAVDHLNLDKSALNIHLLHVVSLSPLVASFTPQSFVTALEENMIMEGDVALANAQKAFSDRGYKKLEMELGHGNPAAEIIKAQEKTGADLIVIGSQGKGAVKHFLMGHVANRIVTHASAPTVVAR
ncbi:MAG: universal stress protein [Cyanobacteria bacterium SZAS TMP-1]|nr:universal stress protein [Cyanobacteria bacterium SZAS TMP-1]